MVGSPAWQWLQEGRQLGREEGREEGRLEGAQLLLVKLLEGKFSPVPKWARTMIREASWEDLVEWAVRVREAPTLFDVLE